jgi:RNA 2',3'-cyclic 3'-phosphodiesterase
MDTARLFLALWPDEQVRAALAEVQASCHWPAAARPTPRANLHATLHFIGPVARERLPQLASGLAAPARRFSLLLDRIELWPNGIAALVPSQAPDELLALHADLAQRLRLLALPVETRPYRPHVTLARRAAGLALPPPGAHAGVQWACASFALVESAGGQYRVLQRHAA